MTLRIYTNGTIQLDGRSTSLAVSQRPDYTMVYTNEGNFVEFEMPHRHYSLASDNPASGCAGLAQFEADIRALEVK
jgi:hypothetical protein